jgi:thioredoxin 1
LDGVVVVDFWGPHCPSCRQLAPELEKVALARPQSVSIVKVDVESSNNMDLAMFFGINAIPRLLVFRDGEPVGLLKGYLSASEILHRLEKVIKVAQVTTAE